MPLKKTVAPQEISVAPDSLLLVSCPGDFVSGAPPPTARLTLDLADWLGLSRVDYCFHYHRDSSLVGIPEAARRMSTTVFAVRELCRSGKLKFGPIGHKWLISPRAIQEFIDKSQRYYEEVAAKEAV